MGDPVLAAIVSARERMRSAERELRVLVAFAREHTRPRPYRLVDVAEAAGMSVSGVRTAYGAAEVQAASGLTVAGLAALPSGPVVTGFSPGLPR